MRGWRRGMLTAVLVMATLGLAVPAAAARWSTQPEPLTSGNAMYPRMIRLRHSGLLHDGEIIASVISFTGGAHAAILRSTDDGRSFHEIGRIIDPMARVGECCGTLFELPTRVDALPAGTLLWAGGFGVAPGDGAAIRVWASEDHGRHWSYLSECAHNTGSAGLWEPELAVTARGRLACYFGDESRYPAHSQVIAMTTSRDGIHWNARRTLVATARSGERPGMPVVRRLPDGRYVMSYENCNVPHYFCGGYLRTSADGVHWGEPGDYGDRVATADGHYFQHAQTLAVLPGGPHGVRLVSVGQIYVDGAGRPAAGNGRTVLINDNLGRGPWHPAPAPVAVPDPYDDPCPNYSSALLPTWHGRALLEIATEYGPSGTCRAYYAIGGV